MKDLMRKVKPFIMFDIPLQKANIAAQFTNTQQKFQTEEPEWSTTATRQKVIADYWLTYVAEHFALILGLPVLIILFAFDSFEMRYILNVFIAGLVSYPIIYLFIYRPNFNSIFLPHLETIKEMYEHRQSGQLEKCRKAQLSNQALCLIFYVFDQASGMNTIQPNDQYAEVLMKLYGVDQGSLKTNLGLILGSSSKRNNLTDRRRTEIRNRFAEAYLFFQKLNFTKGADILKKLEMKFWDMPTEKK